MTCLHGRRSEEVPASGGLAARSCPLVPCLIEPLTISLPSAGHPARLPRCEWRATCIKPARTGVSSQAGHQRLWDLSRSHGRLFSFLPAQHRYKHSVLLR